MAAQIFPAAMTCEVIDPPPRRCLDWAMMMTTQANAPVGHLLRVWRERRHLSQLSLATEAEISQKHLSFIESGRSAPSREMVLHLAEQLDVPLRERNALLLAAGFAPVFRDRPLDDPAMQRARATIDLILKGHEPHPALVVDRQWTLIAANASLAPLMAAADPMLLKPPVNVMRLALHPRGLAPLIVNLGEWRAHLLDRLRRQHRLTLDPAIGALLEEVSGYPGGREHAGTPHDEIAVPFRLRTQAGTLSFISTVTVFGTAVDITLSELSLETFYPADPETAAILRGLAGTG